MPPAAEGPITFAASADHGGAAGPPPDEVRAGPLLLRRMREEDAPVIAATVGASLEHLRPWMPWATPEAADYRVQLARVAEAGQLWASGTDYIYLIVVARDAALAGTIGLHRRVGDGGIEIGYWIAANQIRRGYATEAARAMTAVALALPGVRRVEIHCDEGNVASAGVPRKLGYRLDRIEPHEPEAPGECGRRMIWVWGSRAAPAGENTR
jgi:RimJ/RimL family protein N-acetyltransferase